MADSLQTGTDFNVVNDEIVYFDFQINVYTNNNNIVFFTILLLLLLVE